MNKRRFKCLNSISHGAFWSVSLFLSLLFGLFGISSDTYAATHYVSPVTSYSNEDAIDVTPIIVPQLVQLPIATMCLNATDTSCDTTLTINVDSNPTTGTITYPWQNGYGDDSFMNFPDVGAMYFNPPTDIPDSSTFETGAIQFTCPANELYIADSITFYNSYIYDVELNNTANYTGFNRQYNSSAEYITGDFTSSQMTVDTLDKTANNTVYSIHKLTGGYPVNQNYDFYMWQWANSYKIYGFYILDNQGGSYKYNGVVMGCNRTAVENLLMSIDDNPVNPETDFPNSFNTDDSENNEDAWNILNSIDPEDYKVENEDSTNIIDTLLTFVRSLFVIETSKSNCGIYMPAFFGGNFQFGNDSSGSVLYFNPCDNPFVDGITNTSSWLGIVSGHTAFGGQDFMYLGYKGLVWIICFWILIKMLLGFVYWVYGVIDSAFGLHNEVGDF